MQQTSSYGTRSSLPSLLSQGRRADRWPDLGTWGLGDYDFHLQCTRHSHSFRGNMAPEKEPSVDSVL